MSGLNFKNITPTGKIKQFQNFCYLPCWYMKNVIFKAHNPLFTVISITDYCNLKCRHCTEATHGCSSHKPYEQIKEELIYSYNKGSRFVDFEGGEPTLWMDRRGQTPTENLGTDPENLGTDPVGGQTPYLLNDLYDLAKEIGYFSATLTTNAQQPFGDTKADSVWVSIDGYGKYHDLIRGEGAFERADKNIRESGIKNITINMVINKLNVKALGRTLDYAKDAGYISKISLNFLTPYSGLEDIMLPWDQRLRAIDYIIKKKRQGYPVMNSISGLKLMKNRDYKRACWMSNFILLDGTKLESCPGNKLGICKDCGFCMAGEMSSVAHIRPDTIIEGLKLRF